MSRPGSNTVAQRVAVVLLFALLIATIAGLSYVVINTTTQEPTYALSGTVTFEETETGVDATLVGPVRDGRILITGENTQRYYITLLGETAQIDATQGEKLKIYRVQGGSTGMMQRQLIGTYTVQSNQ